MTFSKKNLSFHWLELSCTSQDPSTTSPAKWLWRPWAVWTPTGPVPSPGRTAVTSEARNKHAAYWTGNLEGLSEQTPYLVMEAIRSRKSERWACPLITGEQDEKFLFTPAEWQLSGPDRWEAVDLSFLCYFSLWVISFYFGLAAMDWRTPLVRSHIPPFGKNQCELLEEFVLKHLAVTSLGAAQCASQWRSRAGPAGHPCLCYASFQAH